MESLSEQFKKLNEQCKARYQNRPRRITSKQIARACNVSESWLTQWSAGKIESPSIKKIECINEYLIINGASIV